jgi:small subunit ribosomal protein S16
MVRVRLTRTGARKQPHYRIVVADERYPRDGRFIENIGIFDPRQNPEMVRVDDERLAYWLGKGARPSQTVSQVLARRAKREKK